MKVVIMGSGNVATVFAEKLFANNTIIITQIVSRNATTGMNLAEKISAEYTQDYNHIDRDADACLICVQDDQLSQVVKRLEKILPKNILVIHTTGSASIKVLENVSSQYGVLYPVQSLRKENSSVREIPLLLDANTPEAMEKLQLLAKGISSNIDFANDEQRIRLHIAAVFVSNFPNYLYMLAASFCAQHQLHFKLLLPLMEETVGRLYCFSPTEIQTGPAARGDIFTINTHKEILQKEKPELLEVYNFLTAHILDYNAER